MCFARNTLIGLRAVVEAALITGGARPPPPHHAPTPEVGRGHTLFSVCAQKVKVKKGKAGEPREVVVLIRRYAGRE